MQRLQVLLRRFRKLLPVGLAMVIGCAGYAAYRLVTPRPPQLNAYQQLLRTIQPELQTAQPNTTIAVIDSCKREQETDFKKTTYCGSRLTLDAGRMSGAEAQELTTAITSIITKHFDLEGAGDQLSTEVSYSYAQKALGKNQDKSCSITARYAATSSRSQNYNYTLSCAFPTKKLYYPESF